MPKWMRILAATFISLLLIVLIGLVTISYIFANTVINSQPVARRTQVDETKKPTATALMALYPHAEYQPVSLVTEDAVKLQGYYHPSRNGAAVLLLHGYRSNHTMMLPIANMLVQHGYGVMMIDFRGHGLSEGSEVTFGIKEDLDAEAAYQYLRAQPGIDPRRIGVLGSSLGGATAILFGAQNPEIRAVIAQSPFASMQDIIWVNTRRALPTPPILLAPLVEGWVQLKLGKSLTSFAPVTHIQAISPRPVLIMMGGQDIMVDPRGGQRLIDAAGDPTILWYDADIGHTEFQEKHPQEFEKRVIAFFEEYLK